MFTGYFAKIKLYREQFYNVMEFLPGYDKLQYSKNYDEELISVNSNNGVLEMKSVLKDRSTVIRTIGRTFRYDDKTGKYIFQNRYLL